MFCSLKMMLDLSWFNRVFIIVQVRGLAAEFVKGCRWVYWSSDAGVKCAALCAHALLRAELDGAARDWLLRRCGLLWR
jgi:hypothetical protein